MEKAINRFWTFRLVQCKETLVANNFEAYTADNSGQAQQIVLNKIIPESKAKTFSYAGSKTVEYLGLLDSIRKNPDLKIVESFGPPAKNRKERMEQCRQALLVDMFITGTNAVTETGILVNLDMWGNRVGAMAYGPRNVIIITGRNKIVPDLEAAMLRIKNYSAPVNAIRHDMHCPRKTPCVETSYCNECKGEWRICNTWVINEKSFPEGRIKVILINEDLGY
jgi:L-lactate utilization protein LutB